jgi:malonyl CoA-acyl carrier protein transacylase
MRIVQTKLYRNTGDINEKLMFTATGGLTDMPDVVLGHSVGVLGQ